jgi:hypothetical protein
MEGAFMAKNPEKCTLARIGGAIGGILAGIPAGLAIGPQIAALVAPGQPDIVTTSNVMSALVCAVIGAIGGSLLAYGTASACDDPGDSGGPGSGITVSTSETVVIWVVVFLAATLSMVGGYRSFLYHSIVTVSQFVPLPRFVPLPFMIWAIGISWQITAGRWVKKARALRPQGYQGVLVRA